MATMVVGDVKLELDEFGYLVDWQAWSEEAAKALARKEGILLTAEHWTIITLIRNYFEKRKDPPIIKILLSDIEKEMGPEKGNLNYVYSLFPQGAGKQAFRIAGIPRPRGCCIG